MKNNTKSVKSPAPAKKITVKKIVPAAELTQREAAIAAVAAHQPKNTTSGDERAE